MESVVYTRPPFYAVLLKPLPFRDPDRVAVAYNAYPKAGVPHAGTSVPHYLERKASVAAFAEAGIKYRPARSAERALLAGKADPQAGQAVDVALKMSNDNGWCAVSVSRGGGAYDAGLLTERPSHGRVSIKTVGDATRIDYTPHAGFAGADALHRSDANAVKAEILSAGFTLAGESQALANAADDGSKPATDASDHFLLHFAKPKNAPPDKRLKPDFLKGWFGNTAMYSPGTDHARAHIYRADGTYDEYGPTDVQGGRWFADASSRGSGTADFGTARWSRAASSQCRTFRASALRARRR